MKSYTDLEQSKKLAEILPIESADMFYRDNGVDVKLMWEHNAQKVTNPCWSLAALLGLIEWDYKLESTLFDQSDYFTYSMVCNDAEHRTFEYSNPLDAAFEMVVWLKENNKL